MDNLSNSKSKNLYYFFLLLLVSTLLINSSITLNVNAERILNTDFENGLDSAYLTYQNNSQYLHTEDGKNHPVANEQGEFLSSSTMLLASNSVFPTPRGTWFFVRITTFLFSWYPDQARIILKGSDGHIKLKQEVPIQQVKRIDSSDWYNPFKEDAYAIYLDWEKIDDVKIPAFAGAGSWRLTFQIWQSTIFERGHVNFVYSANVGQSSLIDTISAPMYYYNEGGFLGFGEFGVSLPSIITFAAIPILLGSIYVLFHIWFGSFKAGMEIIKEKLPQIRRKRI
ncbi:MAG: hypothetical protein ACOC80_13310 [Petrotogales bacterium]